MCVYNVYWVRIAVVKGVGPRTGGGGRGGDPELKMADNAIDAAIESAESLINSFLVRDRRISVQQVDSGVETPHRNRLDSKEGQDPEASLFSPQEVDQSLVTEGVASFWSSALSASSQAAFPELFDIVSPKESLHALGLLITYTLCVCTCIHMQLAECHLKAISLRLWI